MILRKYVATVLEECQGVLAVLVGGRALLGTAMSSGGQKLAAGRCCCFEVLKSVKTYLQESV